MSLGAQSEFLFSDGPTPRLGAPEPGDPLLRDIATAWHLPIGETARIVFRPSESLREVMGRLEVAMAPDLPFDARRPLRLRVRGYEFVHTAIASWTLPSAP